MSNYAERLGVEFRADVPFVSFGNVAVSEITNRFARGESVHALSENLSVTPQQILDAIRFALLRARK